MAHLKLKHRTRNRETCRCKYDQCLRAFNNVHSYKNHIGSEHMNNSQDDIELLSRKNSEIEECFSNDFSSNDYKQSDVPKVLLTSNSDSLSVRKIC